MEEPSYVDGKAQPGLNSLVFDKREARVFTRPNSPFSVRAAASAPCGYTQPSQPPFRSNQQTSWSLDQKLPAFQAAYYFHTCPSWPKSSLLKVCHRADGCHCRHYPLPQSRWAAALESEHWRMTSTLQLLAAPQTAQKTFPNHTPTR